MKNTIKELYNDGRSREEILDVIMVNNIYDTEEMIGEYIDMVISNMYNVLETSNKYCTHKTSKGLSIIRDIKNDHNICTLCGKTIKNIPLEDLLGNIYNNYNNRVLTDTLICIDDTLTEADVKEILYDNNVTLIRNKILIAHYKKYGKLYKVTDYSNLNILDMATKTDEYTSTKNNNLLSVAPFNNKSPNTVTIDSEVLTKAYIENDIRDIISILFKLGITESEISDSLGSMFNEFSCDDIYDMMNSYLNSVLGVELISEIENRGAELINLKYGVSEVVEELYLNNDGIPDYLENVITGWVTEIYDENNTYNEDDDVYEDDYDVIEPLRYSIYPHMPYSDDDIDLLTYNCAKTKNTKLLDVFRENFNKVVIHDLSKSGKTNHEIINIIIANTNYTVEEVKDLVERVLGKSISDELKDTIITKGSDIISKGYNITNTCDILLITENIDNKLKTEVLEILSSIIK